MCDDLTLNLFWMEFAAHNGNAATGQVVVAAHLFKQKIVYSLFSLSPYLTISGLVINYVKTSSVHMKHVELSQKISIVLFYFF